MQISEIATITTTTTTTTVTTTTIQNNQQDKTEKRPIHKQFLVLAQDIVYRENRFFFSVCFNHMTVFLNSQITEIIITQSISDMVQMRNDIPNRD